MKPLELVDAAPLIPVLRDWIDRGGQLDLLPQGPCRRARAVLAEEQTVIRIDALDRLAIALDRPDLVNELAPAPEPSKRSGLWAEPHPLRKITTEQVYAAHRLYAAGYSLRQLGALLYVRFGYSSPRSCANALHQAFARHGLERRERVAATVAASTTHGHGARADKAAYKRWFRAEARAGRRTRWASDAT